MDSCYQVLAINSFFFPDRVRPEPDFPARYQNGTGILVPVSRKQNAFSKFRFRLIQTGFDASKSGLYTGFNGNKKVFQHDSLKCLLG